MRKQYKQRALASKVLAVAVLNLKDDGSLFDWAVYIDAVPGINHSREYMAVANFGAKQNRKVAELFFPEYSISKYRD